MVVINVGATCSNRITEVGFSGYTMLCGGHVANDTGTITDICIWLYSVSTGVKVGILENTSGTTYKTRSVTTLGNLGSGEHNISNLNLAVVAGDVIGMYGTTGFIEMSSTGANLYYKLADQLTVDNEVEYTLYGAYDFSLHGTGATIAAGGGGCMPDLGITLIKLGII